MKSSESNYLSRIAALGCLICGSPAEIHHHRELGEKRKNSKVAPLCPEHHRGASGVHGLGKKAFERYYGVTLTELVARAEQLANG